MAYDANTSQLILSGGTLGSTNSPGTWAFNGSWTRVPIPIVPAGRYLPAMAPLPDGSVFLAGGQSPDSNSEANSWELEPTGWVPLDSTPSPGPRVGASMTFDSSDGYAVLFGGRYSGNGTSNQTLNDTWAFDTLKVRLLPVPSTVVAPLVVTPTVVTSGGLRSHAGATTLAYAWTFGDGSNSTAPTPTHTYNLAGNDTIRLLLRDGLGLSATVSAQVDIEFRLNISIVPVANADLTYEFSAVVANATPPVALTWEFGDGSASVLPSPTHTYNSTGSATVEVQATDANGAVGSANRTFNVTQPLPKLGVAPPGTGSTIGLPVLTVLAIVAGVGVASVIVVAILRRRSRPPASR